MSDEKFYLNTLGVHTIVYKGLTITADELKSDKVVQLITFLIVNRATTVEYSTFAKELWHDGEIDNPKSALKNLVYRARKIFRNHFPGENFIIQTGLGYKWAEDIEVIWDAEVFEECIKEYKLADTTEKKINCLRQAVAMYQGDFMERYQDYMWVNLLSSYYHTLYLSAIKKLCKLDEADRNYKDIYQVCKKSLNYELLDEEIFCYLIVAITELNTVQQGLNVYDQIYRHMVTNMGTEHFNKLNHIHTWLLNLENNSENKSLGDILQELNVTKETHPFFCNYGVFREIYSITLRQSKRKHDIATFMLLTVEIPYNPGQGVVERHKAKMTMKHLEESLECNLRESDVVCRFSEFQYVMLLFNCPEDHLPKVLQRIRDYFKEKYGKTAHATIHETHTFL